jgi:hypothetical protein
MSDAELRKLSPPTCDPDIPPEDRHLSPLERKRNFKLKLIAPLVEIAEKTAPAKLPDLSCQDALVQERAREAGVSAGQVFDALHRYYAFGCVRNALLPNNTGRSGAPGKKRRAKNGVKLGRKNAAVKAGRTDQAGLVLTDQDVENMQDGYSAFVRPGTTVRDAFLSMSAVYYSTGYMMKHGYWTVDLLPANERPTERDFRYHGPDGKDQYAAARRLMGEGHWAKNFRPLVGTARDGITMVGQVGSLDASPIDVNQVACGNPLQPIGVGRGLFVRDAWLGLYMGWHVAINGLCTDDAKLAILRAATDKSTTLQHYGLDLPADDFPSLFFSRYLCDNGELRSQDGMCTIVDELSSRIEFIASGRADRNSPSESGHHSRHRRFDHKITGTTKGRQAQRGEPLAIASALLTRYAYMRLLLLWVHWSNTKQELPLHMIPTEMRREFAAQGKPLNRTRIEVYAARMRVASQRLALDQDKLTVTEDHMKQAYMGPDFSHRDRQLIAGFRDRNPLLLQDFDDVPWQRYAQRWGCYESDTDVSVEQATASGGLATPQPATTARKPVAQQSAEAAQRRRTRAKSQDAKKQQVRAELDANDMRNNGLQDYLTGYPLEKSGKYVFARTWAAPEMPRPGCVWTHSLIIENADLAKIMSAEALLDVFTRPIGADARSTYNTSVPVSSQPKPVEIERMERVEYLLQALYSSPTRQVVAEAIRCRQPRRSRLRYLNTR